MCQTGTYKCFRLHTLENVFDVPDRKPWLDKEDDDAASKESEDSRVQQGIGWSQDQDRVTSLKSFSGSERLGSGRERPDITE